MKLRMADQLNHWPIHGLVRVTGDKASPWLTQKLVTRIQQQPGKSASLYHNLHLQDPLFSTLFSVRHWTHETPTDIPHKLRTFMSLVYAYSWARDEKYTGKPKWKISLGRSRRREVNTFTVDLKEAGVGRVLNNLSGNVEILCTELKK
jgi:hypothetical protein